MMRTNHRQERHAFECGAFVMQIKNLGTKRMKARCLSSFSRCSLQFVCFKTFTLEKHTKKKRKKKIQTFLTRKKKTANRTGFEPKHLGCQLRLLKLYCAIVDSSIHGLFLSNLKKMTTKMG